MAIGIAKKIDKNNTIAAPMSITPTHEKKTIALSNKRIPTKTSNSGKIVALTAKSNKKIAAMKSNNPRILTSIIFKSLICLNNL